MKRRTVLWMGLGTIGALAVGVGLMPIRQRLTGVPIHSIALRGSLPTPGSASIPTNRSRSSCRAPRWGRVPTPALRCCSPRSWHVRSPTFASSPRRSLGCTATSPRSPGLPQRSPRNRTSWSARRSISWPSSRANSASWSPVARAASPIFSSCCARLGRWPARRCAQRRHVTGTFRSKNASRAPRRSCTRAARSSTTVTSSPSVRSCSSPSTNTRSRNPKRGRSSARRRSASSRGTR